MSKREIVVTIDHKTGEQTVEGEHFEGSACSTEIQKFLAGTVTSDKKKPAFYKKASVVVKA